MTEKISYIPTRIKNIVKDGHVTGVEDIIDDVSGKTQKEINADLQYEIDNKAPLITDKEMDEVLDGELATYLKDIDGNIVLDINNKPIEII